MEIDIAQLINAIQEKVKGHNKKDYIRDMGKYPP
jgi:hypothetical protein